MISQNYIHFKKLHAANPFFRIQERLTQFQSQEITENNNK